MINAQEKEWIGKLCWFKDEEDDAIKYIGILTSITKPDHVTFYWAKNDGAYGWCRPVKRDEVEFVE